MIIWRGWGILVPIIPVVLWLFVPQLFESIMSPDAYTEYFRHISAFSILLGALTIWFLGRKLNCSEGRTLVNEETGEKVLLKPTHSFFFINLEYWAIPLILFFLFILFLGISYDFYTVS
jgi:hypothetical protein